MDRKLVKLAEQRMDSDDPTSRCVLVLFYDRPDASASSEAVTSADSLDDVWRTADHHGVDRADVEFRDSCWESLTSPEA